MSESTSKRPGDATIDREIDVRAIVQIGIWLAVVTLVSYLIAWGFYRSLSKSAQRSLDPKPSPVAEANVPHTIPGPQLLARPEDLLKKFRAEERARLEGWGWVDRSKGIAHVPVERALDTVASEGMPSFMPREIETP